MMNDLPFASEVAEIAYQALLKQGVECTRDQFRPAIQAFVIADDISKRKYEEFRKKRMEELREVEEKSNAWIYKDSWQR